MNKPILFVGTATIDYIALVEKIPKSDERIKALNLIKCGGGPAANAATAAKALGASCALISVVGDDPEGEEIINELEELGINTSGIQRSTQGKSPRSLIHVEKGNGNRTITHYGGVIQNYNIDQFPIELLKEASLVHADGNHVSLTLHVFKLAKELAIPTSLDGGNIKEEDLELLLPFTDVFITDKKSIPPSYRNITDYLDVCKELAKKGPHTVGITLGSDGAVVFDSSNFIKTPNYTVKVVDTTGAGDNFHGAYAFGLWYGLNARQCLNLSNIFAAKSCEALGGRGNLVNFEAIKDFI